MQTSQLILLKITPHIFLKIALTGFLFFPATFSSSNAENGFKALSIYDYFKAKQLFYKEIKKIIHSESIDILVFGIPFFVDGKESEMTLKLKKIYQNLSEQIPEVICYMQDETLTTQTAMERMKSSPEYNFKIDQTRIDTLAATIILEDFIRSN